MPPSGDVSKTGVDDVDMLIAEIDGQKLLLVEWPDERSRLSGLSPAARAVLGGIVAGMSNLEIARERGTSPRTVANQVASLLRLFRVGSRFELIATLARSTTVRPDESSLAIKSARTRAPKRPE